MGGLTGNGRGTDMSKRTLASDQNVELTERDLLRSVTVDGEVTDSQLELRIGDWEYESCYKTKAGAEFLIEAIDELAASLDTVRAKLFDLWTGAGDGS